MTSKISNEDDAIVDINITPFVDVVLVLLVIFMVTAHFIVNKGLNLKLPKASTIEQLNKSQKNIQLAITKDGHYMMDGKPINLTGLKINAEQISKMNSKVLVTISADKEVYYNDVVKVMDTFRQGGVSDFALQLDLDSSKHK